MNIDIYISLGLYGYGHPPSLGSLGYSYLCFFWALPIQLLLLIRLSILNILVFQLFTKGCLRISSILRLCWLNGIQAWYMTTTPIEFYYTQSDMIQLQIQESLVAITHCSQSCAKRQFTLIVNWKDWKCNTAAILPLPDPHKTKQLPTEPKTESRPMVYRFERFYNKNNVPASVLLNIGCHLPVTQRWRIHHSKQHTYSQPDASQ
jgi:hypothetical protein